MANKASRYVHVLRYFGSSNKFPTSTAGLFTPSTSTEAVSYRTVDRQPTPVQCRHLDINPFVTAAYPPAVLA